MPGTTGQAEAGRKEGRRNVSDVRVLLCTCPPSAADGLAAALVERRLVACVNAIAGVASRYRWKGEVVKDDETLLILKTTTARVADIISVLKDLHPYDVPELLSLPVEEGSEGYINWVRAETAPGES